MLFTSYSFFLFLAVLAILYYLIPAKFRWMLLLIASLSFYAFSGPGYLLFILATALTTFYTGLKLDALQRTSSEYIKQKKEELSIEERKAYKERMKKRQRLWLVLCMVINFGILAVLKYSDFTIININTLLDVFKVDGKLPLLGFVLPLGISFYTFQTMGYIIDVYRGKYPCERNFPRLLLFISFFPQLVQGPISRYDDLKETLYSGSGFVTRNISYGLQSMLWGYFKKLVIADRLFVAVSTIIRNPGEYQGVFVLCGMFLYAIELYADFTGGIDIALGVAQIFGIKLKENFQRPYFSKSITEYWRRWHITLGTWFRDYMFYPISVSKPMQNLSRKGRKTLGDTMGKRLPVYIATLVIWFTTGIWHGAAWNFIVWGLLNAVVILISQECIPLYNKFHSRFKVRDAFWYRLFQVVRTFWLMSFLRTFDCYMNVGLTFRMYGTILTKWNLPELFQGGKALFGLSPADYIVFAAGAALMLFVSLRSRAESFRDILARRPLIVRYAVYFALIIAILLFGAYGPGYDSSQFIYSRF